MKQPKVKLTWEEIKVSRKWTKKWKEDPEHMEYIRSTRATPAAKKRHDELNQSLIEVIKQLPEKLTLTDLKGWLMGIPYYNKKTGKERNRKSLFKRLIRRRLIRYDATTKKWINLTHSTTSSGSEETNDPNLQN